MYTFEKVTVEKIEVKWIWYNFYSSFGRLKKVRKDEIGEGCEFCNSQLLYDQPCNLAFTTNTTNKLVCLACADRAVEGGAGIYQPKGEV